MRKTQATNKQSELRRVSQACFHLLASERENICDLVLPNYADASSCAGRILRRHQINHREDGRLSRFEHFRILISPSIFHGRVPVPDLYKKATGWEGFLGNRGEPQEPGGLRLRVLPCCPAVKWRAWTEVTAHRLDTPQKVTSKNTVVLPFH
jgi:hypothetical protein